MASGSLASRDPYDEEAAVRRPLELDGRDAAVSASSSSSDYLPGKLAALFPVNKMIFTSLMLIPIIVSIVGSVLPRHIASSAKGDTSNKYYDEWRQHTTDDVRKSKSGSRYFTAFGVDLSPDNMAVAIVYFVQGVLGLARLAVSFYLKDDLHLDPAEAHCSYIWFLVLAMVDQAPLWIYKVVDSMVVERARGESQSTSGSLQSLCWGSSAFGGIVSAYFSGSLVDAYGVRFVFGVTAFLPLMTSAVAVLVNEHRIPSGECNILLSGSGFVESSKQHVRQLWVSVKQPNIFLPTLFIFLWQATPQSDSAMFFFNPVLRLQSCWRRANLFLLAVGIGSPCAPLRHACRLTHCRFTLRRSYSYLPQAVLPPMAHRAFSVLLVTGLNRQFGISDEWFSIGDSLIITVLGFIYASLGASCKLCPPGMEATLFATLMSISNAGSVTGGLIGAALTRVFGVTRDTFGNLPILIVVCNLSSLLPLPLLGLLPEDSGDTDNEEIKHN
ncbi:hypothetical protein PR202_ga28228 [Eleusine coracana subsp. coracana]|uniref:Uncharacterized protein n=1 Tax=Eleusine coracana subsp. coracana TaxID=191504 RepID=A0AAV5DIK0_ELECO|nr:hypothetical protein PR202_ga28228 [Eleusine coracana subsp. coracana]